MTFRLRLRDWLLANDPAFSRLRQASRITATVVISVALLIAFHFIATPLPPAAYGLAITLSIEGGLAVRDRTALEQLVTRILAVVTGVAMVTLASALEGYRHVSDVIFLAIIFVAVYGRAFAARRRLRRPPPSMATTHTTMFVAFVGLTTQVVRSTIWSTSRSN